MKTMILLSLTLCSTAFAGDPKAAAGAPAVPAAEKKAPDAAPAPMKPAPELTDMAKAMAGTWKCAGKAEMSGVMGDLKGTITHKADLDGFWIASSLTVGTGKSTFHGTFLTTYDAASKKFFRMSANSHGGHESEWGTVADKKVSWEGDGSWGTKQVKLRGTEEAVSPKETHIVGEYSEDGGRTWKVDHDVSCKK
jgi:hypothetical protein